MQDNPPKFNQNTFKITAFHKNSIHCPYFLTHYRILLLLVGFLYSLMARYKLYLGDTNKL